MGELYQLQNLLPVKTSRDRQTYSAITGVMVTTTINSPAVYSCVKNSL